MLIGSIKIPLLSLFMSLRNHFFVADKNFVKEFLLAAFILLNSLLPQLHLVVKADLSTLHFLGIKVIHSFPDNQFFVWTQLCYVQSLLMVGVFFHSITRRYKYVLLFLIYWFLYSILFFLFEKVTNESDMMLIKNSCLFVVFMPYLVHLWCKGFLITPCKSITKQEHSKTDVIVFFLLLCLPFLDKLNENYTPRVSELLIFNYSFDSGGWQFIHTLFWFIIIKLNFLVPSMVLFFTVKKWWRYALLFPILLTIYQLKNGVDPNLEYVDKYEIFEAFPMLLGVLILLLFLSRSAYYQSKMKELYQRTYHHLERVLRNRFKRREIFLSETRDRFQRLKNSKNSKEEELYQLKQRLEQELQKH